MNFKLNRISSIWDRINRNATNENWNKIEKVISDRGLEILSEEGFLTWLDENGIKHREEVEFFSDLPSSDPLNTVRGVESDNKIYIKKENGWVPFQSIDISKINRLETVFENEIDDRGVNIKRFGAVGDGVTDDTDAIQEALDTGQTVLIPHGIFLAGDIKINNNTRIIGVGREHSIIRHKPNSNNSLFSKRTVGAVSLEISDVTFDDNGVINDRKHIEDNILYLYDVFPITIERCNFINMYLGINIETSEQYASENITHNIVFRDCEFSSHSDFIGNEHDVAAINVNRAMNDGLIENCTFKNLISNAVRVFPYGEEPNNIAPQRWTFKDSIIENIFGLENGVASGNGIYYRGDNALFDGMHIKNTKRNCLDIQGINNQKTTGKNIRINNCTLSVNNGYASNQHAAVIHLRNVDAVISNTEITCDNNSQSSGVVLKWGGSLMFNNNKIFTPLRNGIECFAVNDDAFPSVISDVIVTNSYIESGPPTDRAAVHLMAVENRNFDTVIISNNIVRNHVVKVSSQEGSGRVTKLVVSGNETRGGNTMFRDFDDLNNVTQYKLTDRQVEMASHSVTLSALNYQGLFTLYGEDSGLRLPINTNLESLPTPNFSNKGRLYIIRLESGEEQLYINLANSNGSMRWKRLDME